MKRAERPLRIAVGAGCAYEIVALCSDDRVPTISYLCWVAREHPLGFVLVVAFVLLTVWHFLGTGFLAKPRRTGPRISPASC